MGRYPLGTSQDELDRLRFQQSVWGPVTARFLDRLELRPGARVADLGCGPGFLLDDFLARVGPSGEVVLVDEAERWHDHLAPEIERRALPNVRLVRARIQDVELAAGSFDLLFARWVLSFVPDPASVVRRLARALRPGGVFAVEDYNHEGISVFPESEGFRAVVRATRALYAQGGGDTWIAGRIAGIFRAAGLETVEIVPNVLAGGPGSPVFRWADRFFPAHSQAMVEKGLLSESEREQFLAEWSARLADPDALFFSPIVVDAAARKR